MPYLSIDTLKEGMLKNCPAYRADAEKDPDAFDRKTWRSVKGIIDTCLENDQNLIVEGKDISPEEIKSYPDKNVLFIFMGFSASYIKRYYDKIVRYAQIIQKRDPQRIPNEKDLIAQHDAYKQKCAKAQVSYFEISCDYERELRIVYNYFQTGLMKAKGLFVY